MSNAKRTRRRLLSAGVGAVAFTALEGLACGNPLEPRCPDGSTTCESDARSDAPDVVDAGVDAATDSAIDTAIDVADGSDP
jgi:hypothetical protein